MVKTSGKVQACSPRGPAYSGKLIARAVELYRDGVKPGYMRWHELQARLEKEFPGEFKHLGQDKPSPDTVMDWVRKYPDAPERLKQLRVQQADAHPSLPQIGASAFVIRPLPAIPIACESPAESSIRELFGWLAAFMFMLIMARCARSVFAA